MGPFGDGPQGVCGARTVSDADTSAGRIPSPPPPLPCLPLDLVHLHRGGRERCPSVPSFVFVARTFPRWRTPPGERPAAPSASEWQQLPAAAALRWARVRGALYLALGSWLPCVPQGLGGFFPEACQVGAGRDPVSGFLFSAHSLWVPSPASLSVCIPLVLRLLLAKAFAQKPSKGGFEVTPRSRSC